MGGIRTESVQETVEDLDLFIDALAQAGKDVRETVMRLPFTPDDEQTDLVVNFVVERYQRVGSMAAGFDLTVLQDLTQQIVDTLLKNRQVPGFQTTSRAFLLKLAQWLKNVAIFLKHPQRPTAEAIVTVLPDIKSDRRRFSARR